MCKCVLFLLLLHLLLLVQLVDIGIATIQALSTNNFPYMYELAQSSLWGINFYSLLQFSVEENEAEKVYANFSGHLVVKWQN